MKATFSLIPSRILLFYAMGVLWRSALAMEQLSSSLQNEHLGSALNGMTLEDPAEKRAYTYVSEYKRLPVYNFGIGKRWAESTDDKRGRQYSFGLGKRTRPYSFGLGKRNEQQDYNPLRLNIDYPIDGFEGPHSREESLDDFLENKRSRQPYSFGLGKRAWNLAPGETIGTGKRPNDLLSQRYHFGLGKRVPEEEDAM